MMTHILVIDDDPLVRYSVRTILEGAGHEVTEADNGRSGLESFRATRYDAVITDIIMPDMEGIETIRAIRALDRQMPVLAMSAAAGWATPISPWRRGRWAPTRFCSRSRTTSLRARA
jgi:CheY-like chemotaxis protein